MERKSIPTGSASVERRGKGLVTNREIGFFDMLVNSPPPSGPPNSDLTRGADRSPVVMEIWNSCNFTKLPQLEILESSFCIATNEMIGEKELAEIASRGSMKDKEEGGGTKLAVNSAISKSNPIGQAIIWKTSNC